MIAAKTDQPTETKICKHCWARRPITDFRYMNRKKGKFHPECRDCRRIRTLERKVRQSRFAMVDGMRKIRRAQTAAQVANLVEAIAAELGGIGNVVAEFLKLSEHVDPRTRFKAAQTLLKMACVADLTALRLHKEAEESPESVVRRRYTEEKLLRTMRRWRF